MIHFLPEFSNNIYNRKFTAEVDVLASDELLLKGTMQDHRFALQQTWELRTPTYEILAAAAQQHAGNPEKFAPELCGRYANLKGIKIGRGFTKQILQVLGDLPGVQEHLFLAMELARSSQQVYQFPPEFEAKFAALPNESVSLAHNIWIKDRMFMDDLKNSCHSYRDESDLLFKERDIRCGFDPLVPRPQPGDKRIFWRSKRVMITKNVDESFTCESAMEDGVHDILIGFTLDKYGVISNAHSRGLRLPFQGLCEDPQQRTTSLNGLRVTENYVKEVAACVGGTTGCTHLFDLSMDCLRLVRFENC